MQRGFCIIEITKIEYERKIDVDFIAVDFETPNRKNDTVCSMGITFVKNSEIIFNENVLIDPETNFDISNTKIHGISEKDIAGKPNFAKVWEKYWTYFNHYPVVMHNVDFDTSVLYKAAFHANVIMPDMDFYCTKQLCEENYQMDKYSLANICNCMDIDLDNHNSGSDSLCTAKIMLHLINDENASIHIRMGSNEFHEKAQAYASRAKKREPIKHVAVKEAEYEKPDCEYIDCEIEFAGKRFALTGDFGLVTRGEAEKFIEENGGKVTSSVSKKTNYVIVGIEDKTIVGADGKSRKIEAAEELIKEGFDIKIVEAEKLVQIMKSKK